jgi:hypothetical protein
VANYQGSYNGLNFGPGTNVQLVKIEGLRDTTSQASGDTPLPRLDGVAPGINTLGERVLVLTFAVFAPSVPFETVIASIATAFQPISNPSAQLVLQFQLPGWASPRQVTGRPGHGGIPIDLDFQYNVAQSFAIELVCSDPLIYDSTLQTNSAGLPSPTAGLTFPATPNFVFGASTGGSFQVTNLGNYPAPFQITITGPCTNPLITLGSQFLGFTVTLGASDSLVIDTHSFAHSAVLNGTASRAGTILTGSSWLTLPPGVSTIGVASSDSSPVTALFTGAWRSSWGFM